VPAVAEATTPPAAGMAASAVHGMSDQQIVQGFVRDYGVAVYLAPPSPFGWIVPYTSVGFGLVVIWLFIRKYHKPRAVTEAGPMTLDDPALEKYQAQIDKDLANLEKE